MSYNAPVVSSGAKKIFGSRSPPAHQECPCSPTSHVRRNRLGLHALLKDVHGFAGRVYCVSVGRSSHVLRTSPTRPRPRMRVAAMQATAMGGAHRPVASPLMVGRHRMAAPPSMQGLAVAVQPTTRATDRCPPMGVPVLRWMRVRLARSAMRAHSGTLAVVITRMAAAQMVASSAQRELVIAPVRTALR